jgi:putative NIF3 family GTP cyclohydrolase 1 type 2
VPKARLAGAVRAFLASHPYEEPAFDLYEVEDVLPGVGLGRVGTLAKETSVQRLVERVAQTYECGAVTWSGEDHGRVRRVGVLPGSGSKAVEVAAGLCEVLISGDLNYHDGEKAAEMGMALIDVPHGDLEWWAFKRWAGGLREGLAPSHVGVTESKRWRPWWRSIGAKAGSEGSLDG